MGPYAGRFRAIHGSRTGAYRVLGRAATRTGTTDQQRTPRDAYAAGVGSLPGLPTICGEALRPHQTLYVGMVLEETMVWEETCGRCGNDLFWWRSRSGYRVCMRFVPTPSKP
jgi:hypothetical protein